MLLHFEKTHSLYFEVWDVQEPALVVAGRRVHVHVQVSLHNDLACNKARTCGAESSIPTAHNSYRAAT